MGIFRRELSRKSVVIRIKVAVEAGKSQESYPMKLRSKRNDEGNEEDQGIVTGTDQGTGIMTGAEVEAEAEGIAAEAEARVEVEVDHGEGVEAGARTGIAEGARVEADIQGVTADATRVNIDALEAVTEAATPLVATHHTTRTD